MTLLFTHANDNPVHPRLCVYVSVCPHDRTKTAGTTLCCVQKKTPTYIFNYNSGISWSIFITFVPMEREINEINTIQFTYLQS